MNHRLPYEDELSRQMGHLPLPDENEAWLDMKRRLEKDEDDTKLLPPFISGCMLYGLLLAALITGLWLLRDHIGKKSASAKAYVGRTVKKSPAGGKAAIHYDTGSGTGRASSIKSNTAVPVENQAKKLYPEGPPKQARFKSGYNLPGQPARQGYRRPLGVGKSIPATPGDTLKQDTGAYESVPRTMAHKNQNKDHRPVDNTDRKTGYQDTVAYTGPAEDSIVAKQKDTAAGKAKRAAGDTSKVTRPQTDSLPKKKIYFGAGLGLQQQLPIGGQKLVPYNSLGRKGTLGDYIPSLYVRVYKEKKWFVQSEFRYGAPQYTKEILYIQRKVIDSFNHNTTSTSGRLKKTFYHQVPVSFSYYVLPGLSLGAGLSWNRFVSAISEQKVQVINNITFDSTTNTTLVRSRSTDSNFAKSYFQGVIETQYHRKRLSAGARYSFGLQPYLTFDLPGGERREEKNSSLQVFIKYDLWRSRNKTR